MKLLSIDPNTRHSGAVLWIDGKPEAHSVDLHRPNIDEMVKCLLDMTHRLWPDVVAIEDVFHGDNPHTTIVLAKLVGGIQHSIRNMYYRDVLVIGTAAIDKACNLSYRAGERKDATHALARLELGDHISEHVSDAYCVGIAALGKLKERGWAKEQA